jgi:hypothetical protein
MTNEKFDPLKTREEQGLESIPSWLFSVAKQRKMLKSKGLRESAPNADGWTTLERIPPPPMFNERVRPRSENLYGPDEKAVTEREQKRYMDGLLSRRKVA